MTIKGPEIATAYGGLDDAAFTDGAPLSAATLRELARNTNRLAARGGLLWRWVDTVGDASVSLSKFYSVILGPMDLTYMVPQAILPIRKKPGIRQFRVRVRFRAVSGAHVLIRGQTQAGIDDAYAEGLGLDTTTAVQLTLPAREGPGEALSFAWRWSADPENDPLIDTGTYGGASSGSSATIRRSGFILSSQFTTDPSPAGHYLIVKDGNGRIEHIAGIESYDTVYEGWGTIRPRWPTELWNTGRAWEVRRRSPLQLISIAVYGADRTF
jgi:hypothetical protein